MVHYFAYGSNMLTARLKARVESASVLAVGRVPGRTLTFNKRSTDGSGKCDIPETDGNSAMLGVVYQVACSDLDKLDRCEGCGYGYERETLDVLVNETPLACETYIATNPEDGLRPYNWYKALVLAGILEHGLPDWYIEQVYEVAADKDPVRNRNSAEKARDVLRQYCAARPEHADKLNVDWENA